MRRNYKYRIYPNRQQTAALEHTLDACRWLYNHFLEQRKNAWEDRKESLNRFGQMKTFLLLTLELSVTNIYTTKLTELSQ